MGSPNRKLILLPAAVVATIVAAVALASCASLQRSWDEGNGAMVADLINTGQPAKLAVMSVMPFLLDGEIIALRGDVAAFWEGIVKAGFKIEGATLEQGTAVITASYRAFANTMEVKSFFSQYVKDGSRILDLRTSSGKHVLLLFRDAWFSKTILGFKGPF